MKFNNITKKTGSTVSMGPGDGCLAVLAKKNFVQSRDLKLKKFQTCFWTFEISQKGGAFPSEFMSIVCLGAQDKCV